MKKPSRPLVTEFAQSLITPIRRGVLSTPSRTNVKKFVTHEVKSAQVSTSPVVTKYVKRSLKVGPVVKAVTQVLEPIFKRLEKQKVAKKQSAKKKPKRAPARKKTMKKSPIEKAVPMPKEDSLSEFARDVMKTARSSNVPSWHGSVFISDLYQELRPSISIKKFKEYLLQAHREGLLTLSRADLVGSMPASKVEASEIPVGSTTLHFVRLDE